MSTHKYMIQLKNETILLNDYSCFLKAISLLLADNEESFLEASFLQKDGSYKTILEKGWTEKIKGRQKQVI